MRLLFLCLAALSLMTSFPLFSADAPKKTEQQSPLHTPQPPQAPVQEEPSVPPSSEQMTHSYESAFVKMIVTLIGLVLFVLLTIWVLRKIGQGRLRGFGSNRSIQIIEKHPLSPKSMLYLIDVDNKRILVSESQFEVRKIAELDELASEEDN